MRILVAEDNKTLADGIKEMVTLWVGRARRIHTRDARFAFHAGMIALALGHRPEAATLLREALATNAHFDARGAAEARRALATLGDAGA